MHVSTGDVNVNVQYQHENGNADINRLPRISTTDTVACNAVIHGLDHLMLPVGLEELKSSLSPSIE